MRLEVDVEEEKSSKASASPFKRDASILLRRYICMRSTLLRQVHVSATVHKRDALEVIRNEQAALRRSPGQFAIFLAAAR